MTYDKHNMITQMMRDNPLFNDEVTDLVTENIVKGRG